MNQRFLSNFSIVIIKHCINEDTFHINSQSFIRSSLCLKKQAHQSFQASLFYIQVEGNERDYKIDIQFGTKIALRHKISNKYLSYSEQFEEEENDTTYKIQLSLKKYYFKLLPCFQYQTKISTKVKFNQDVYLTSDINHSKTGYVSTRPSEIPQQKRAVLGINFKSKFLVDFYDEYQKQAVNHIYGSIVWLNHVQSSTLLRVNTKAGKNEVIFDSLELDRDLQQITGLWLLESQNLEKGGKISFDQKLRLKNLSTGQYLSFPTYKFNSNERVYNIALQESPNDQNKFIFQSLRGDDQLIKKGSYLILRHCQSKLYMGCRKNTKLDDDFLKPIAYSDFDDEDLFKLILLNQNQEQVIRFIFSTCVEIDFIVKNLDANKLNDTHFKQMQDIFVNIKNLLEKFKNYELIYDKLQRQMCVYIGSFCLLIRNYRKMLLIQNYRPYFFMIVNFITYSYQILQLICSQCPKNQLQSQKHVNCYVEEIFKGVGAEELMIITYSNNYEILCQIQRLIPDLDNQNIVRAVMKQILRTKSDKDQFYWKNISKIVKLIKTLIVNDDTPIDINQRLISEQLFDKNVFSAIFFDIRISNKKIKIGLQKEGRNIQYFQIPQIKDKFIINIIQQVLELFSMLCADRNLISKKYIHKLLNFNQNKQGTEVIISYLNDISLSSKLVNNLYSLVTNLYVDSCPRIQRVKPLKVINFAFHPKQVNKSSVQQAELSGRLKQVLINKMEEAYVSRPLSISNLISFAQSLEPTLTPNQLAGFKQELFFKLEINKFQPQILKAIYVMIELQSFEITQIIEIYNLMCKKLNQQMKSEVAIEIMIILQSIVNFKEEMQLKKFASFLKYKYRFKLKDFDIKSQIKFTLPNAPKLFSLKNNKQEQQSDNISTQSFNQHAEILQKLQPNKQLILNIWKMFIKENQQKNLPYLRQIYKTMMKICFPTKTCLHNIMDSILITSDQVVLFENLFQLYKKLNHLVSISQCWLCQNTDSQKSQWFLYYLNQIIQNLHNGYMSPTQLQPNSYNQPASVKTNNININRQLLIYNLGFMDIIIELLQTNYYLLDPKHKNKKIVSIFTMCFQFLYGFIYGCVENKNKIRQQRHIIEKYNNLMQVGQTKVSIEFYKDSPNNLRKIASSQIQNALLKIIKNSKPKSHQGCQFNPQYVKFIETIITIYGKFHRGNMQKLLRIIERLNIVKKLCYVEQKNNSVEFCLDMFKFKSDPIQIPYLYHVRILKVLNDIIFSLDNLSSSLRSKIVEIFSIDYFLSLLANQDIYTHFGVKAQMTFLLKKEIYRIINCHLDKKNTSIKLNNNEHFVRLINFYEQILIKRKQRKQEDALNQTIYLPYLKQYKNQLSYYQNNLRNHYIEDIKPFLMKVLTIFKIDNTNKINFIIQNLLSQIKPQELSQTYQLKNTTKSIDNVKFKWRNFIDQDHSEQQKFAKAIIIKVLRSKQSQQILKEQKLHFYQLIESNIDDTIKATISLLSLNMNAELRQRDPYSNTNQILYILKQIHYYIKQQCEKHSEQIVVSLTKYGFVQIIIEYLTKNTFHINSTQNIAILNYSLNVINFMLTSDDEHKTAKNLYKIFQENILSYRFFNYLKQVILVINDRLDGSRPYQHINNALSELYFCVEEKAPRIDEQALEFIGNLCIFSPFTTYLRYQSMNTSIDFLQKIYNSLIYVLYQQTDKIKLSVARVDAAEDLLVALTAMMRGGNKTNQAYLIDSKFPETLCQVIKLHEMKPFRSKQQISESQRLLDEVIQFYHQNGVMIGNDLKRKMEVIDFTHPYILNRIKNVLLKTLLECLAGNDKCYSKVRFKVPIQLLKINLIWIYDDFKNGQYEYSEENLLRQKLSWSELIDEQNLNPMFLQIGFYFYELIENLTIHEKEKAEQDDFTSDDREKEKKKIVTKFFNTITEKEKKKEKIMKLDNEKFEAEMKQFYQKYYEALQFFGEKTLTIQVNFNESLTKVFFPKIPLCNNINDEMKRKFTYESIRVSQQQKIKSLLGFQKQFYQLIAGEQQFQINFSKKLPFLGFIIKNLSESQLKLAAAVLSLIITIIFLIDNYNFPTFTFRDQFVNKYDTLPGILIQVFKVLNLVVGLLLAIFLFANKMPILFNILDEQQRQRNQNQKKADGLSKYRIIYILRGLAQQSIYIIFIILMIMYMYLHPLFAAFLLIEFVNRMQLGRFVFRSIKETWAQLLGATFVLIFFNYLYSMYNYLFWSQTYAPTCSSLYQCLLFLVDQSLKSDSGYLGVVPIIYKDSSVNIKFLTDLIYIVFAQKVIADIFAGTIIDKFSELRQKNEQTQVDEQSYCYICGQQRFNIDFQLQGFEEHTQINHNPMNYIFYLFYLRRKSKFEYGIVQNYVNDCQNKKKNHWIPFQTSISKVAKQTEQQTNKTEQKQQKFQSYLKEKTKQIRNIKSKCQNIISQLKSEKKD